ncbi:cytochrome c biogenesis protein DipZ [Rhodoblastus acidophilus]|uniref:Cytochrome c biogenesis protein DipZ n=1 Tax=Candidatus Rhodoblastus alkanivorans TaxID=2954117 RepID=A0ABS9Z325_9HYPH|nr:cytochrome c biogenesis protein DipZ [Candidatus Rhodoblastus alkanivorans]MCI4677340.1 cytochrome c biogenesis protein DipZ [Candidatus Rhodoblastus alkanivorans]MCI4682075.1 cytochrome c biogenesis protein DipZ [Candidatus Rhodoblastus alkanivorans]MDI4639377.1 cytochrome c biogenesis protein DipZ [Rhodoblastus acidophilus]
MILYLLAFLGGALTIASPCILPVLPFVFAGAGRSFGRRGLPMLLGMAMTFALVATLAAVGGGWAAHANSIGRDLALALMALFGLALLWPGLSERLSAPLVSLGGRLSQRADGEGGIGASLLLGVATGLLWAPCAGPILGVILTGAALKGASAGTSFLLLAYGLGAATSLALALLIGGKVFAAMKRSLGIGEWARRGFGVAVLVAVAAIALGADTGFLANLSLASTDKWEQALIDKFTPAHAAADQKASVVMAPGEGAMMMKAGAGALKAEPARLVANLPDDGPAPALTGAVAWLDSPPLTWKELKGKVVLVDFWTYSCINCLRTLPYVRAWADRYRDQGLVVIGVHAPEFAFERDISNVKRAVADLHIDYPVAIDNDYAIWRAFGNQYWPAEYLIDARGHLRHQHFGEGDYAETEKAIQELLAEAGHAVAPSKPVLDKASGVEAAPDFAALKSPETYIGYGRAENFASPDGAVQDRAHAYEGVADLKLNQWSLAGDWTVQEERAELDKPGGAIFFRFHARDLNLVLGPGADGKPVRFKVTVDGAVPGASHGVDVNAQGEGTVTGDRLYQLVRQSGDIRDRLFRIEFLDPGVRAYAFTFG